MSRVRALPLTVQAAFSAIVVAAVTLVLYQMSARLFLDRSLSNVRLYGLAYVGAVGLLTLLGGRRLGGLTLFFAAAAAAFLLPPRDTLMIGDPEGVLEWGCLILLGLITLVFVSRWEWWLSWLAKNGYRIYALVDRLWHRPNLIFICSHMRSGSTLLTHLLISHPQIIGYGETHLTYSEPSDFETLLGKVMIVRRRLPGTVRELYVLDKVLHDYHLDPAILPLMRERRVHIILLAREPRGALSSMMKTLGNTEDEALEHYLNRMHMIAHMAKVLSKRDRDGQAVRPVAVTYEQILSLTEPTFRLMQNYLVLDGPLNEDYRVLPTTGKFVIGDPSEKIRTGSIVREQSNVVPLSAVTLTRAEAAYQRCLDVLEQHCQTAAPLQTLCHNLPDFVI